MDQEQRRRVLGPQLGQVEPGAAGACLDVAMANARQVGRGSVEALHGGAAHPTALGIISRVYEGPG